MSGFLLLNVGFPCPVSVFFCPMLVFHCIMSVIHCTVQCRVSLAQSQFFIVQYMVFIVQFWFYSIQCRFSIVLGCFFFILYEFSICPILAFQYVCFPLESSNKKSLHHQFLCLFVYLRFVAGLVQLSTNLG